MRTFGLFLVLLFLGVCACRKEAIEPIEGAWESIVPARPDWVYTFDDGVLSQATPFGVKSYPIEVDGDTVRIISGTGVVRWVLVWVDEDTVEIEHLDSRLALPKVLKRK